MNVNEERIIEQLDDLDGRIRRVEIAVSDNHSYMVETVKAFDKRTQWMMDAMVILLTPSQIRELCGRAKPGKEVTDETLAKFKATFTKTKGEGTDGES